MMGLRHDEEYRMITQDVGFSVLVLDDEVRCHILNLLRKNELFSVGIVSLDELINPSKREANTIILIDCEGVLAYGVTVISKLKTSCRECKLILLCCQAHRSMIKRVMELGAYGCIIEPYREWELLTMVRLILSGQKIDKKIKPKADRGQGRKPQEK
jgi:DNA-binding NarL/FixJ family response regulator